MPARRPVTVQSPPLGLLLWWDLEGVSVPAEQVRRALAAEGVTDYAVPDVEVVDQRLIRLSVVAPWLHALCAVSLKTGGGFYFASEACRTRVDQLQRVVQAMGGRFHIAHLDASPESRASVAASVTAHVLDELAGVRERVAKWNPSGRKVRPDSQATLFYSLHALMNLIAMYEAALGAPLVVRHEVECCRDAALGILAAAPK